MTDTRYKIVFIGELMPEAALDAVKDNLARLFKSERNKIDALFTGNPVALKRDLTADEADKYIGALQNAGAKVYKEQDLAASLSLVETDDHRTTPVEETARMTCPKCGHEQVKAIECSACGIVIDKYIARQAQLAEAAAAAPAPAPTAVPPALSANAAPAPVASPYATPQAQVGDPMAEFSELKLFGIEGRIGRVRYLGWSMGLTLLALPVLGLLFAGAMALSPYFAIALMVIAWIGLMVVSVGFGAKRLHDLDWSAWFLLLMLVPVVGSVFPLLMLILPGTSGPNRYGPPSPPNSKGVVVLAWSILVVPVLIGILAAIAIPQYQNYVERAEQSSYSQPYSDESGEVSAEPSADYAEPAEAAEPAEPADDSESDQQ